MSKNKIIRDISWLSFNHRVLEEAMDSNVHLYERLRFLGIFSNNLDEFYRVRVATLNKMRTLQKKTAKMHLEHNPQKILEEIEDRTNKFQKTFDRTFNQIIRKLKSDYKIHLKNEKSIDRHQKKWVRDYFEEKVRAHIVPLMIESMPSAPLLRDRDIYLACVLGSTENPMLQRYALIQVPEKQIKRFIILPFSGTETHIMMLEDVIRFNLKHLFAPFGFNKFSGHIIKVTRDAELDFDQDLSSDIIKDLEKSLRKRKKGNTTRLVYDKRIDKTLLNYLVKRLDIQDNAALIAGGRIHNFKAFMDFPKSIFNDIIPRPKPFVHPLLKQPCRIMDIIHDRDVMLHFPYHSFDSVIDLLREASIDPLVQSIKITIYRLAKDSKVITALKNAVRNGKEVTVIIELKARFDEEANLKWKSILEEEGVKVYVGIPDMKVHAKLCLITKKEFNKVTQYGFVSTGNFHEGTARVYGDHLLMTCKKEILSDIKLIFNILCSETPDLTQLENCKYLITSPNKQRDFFLEKIQNQLNLSKEKQSIKIKLNSLVDPILIKALYKAAENGLNVDLIIRGICTVITTQTKFKKQIHAISIVDQYLEHARAIIFGMGKNCEVFISSADWMVRNLDHRVEVACKIESRTFKEEILEIYNIQLKENVKARILDNKQSNRYVKPKDGETLWRSQIEIYKYLKSKRYD